MSSTLKQFIAIAVSASILYIAYIGSYLPLRKGQMFIEATRRLDGVRSLDEFKQILSEPLDYYSPIGQEELVRNMGSMALNIVQQSGDKKGVAQSVVQFLEEYYKPIIARGRGMSFGQDLYVLGAVNMTAAVRTQQASFLDAAVRYFELGHSLAPKRPQFLYGLLDVYRLERKYPQAKAIAEQIIAQWPNDDRVKGTLSEIEKNLGSSGAATSARP